MEKTVTEEEFVDLMKENYVKRTDEVDAFSKRLSNMYAEVNTEFLYGCLNIAQHYLDLQRKYANQPYFGFIPDLASSILKQNTEAWIQTVQNIDSVFIESMKNLKNNLRAMNRNSILVIQNAEKFSDMYEGFQANQKSSPDEKKIQTKPTISKKPNQNLNQVLQSQ